MPIGCIGNHADTPRHFTQDNSFRTGVTSKFDSRLQQSMMKIAMAIGIPFGDF
jgi:hypothetical protein